MLHPTLRRWPMSLCSIVTLSVLLGPLGCSGNDANQDGSPQQVQGGQSSNASGGATGNSLGGASQNLGGASKSSGTTASGGAPASGGSAPQIEGGSSVGGSSSNQAAGGVTAGGSVAVGGTKAIGGSSATAGAGSSGGSANGGTVALGGRGGSGGRASSSSMSIAGRPSATGGRSSTGGSSAKGGTSTATSTTGTAGSGSTDCPYAGHVSYTLKKASSPTADQQAAYDKITAAMDTAVRYYNCYTNITKTLNVSYEPSVATADGNINGSIRFGSTASMNKVTAMHEISHTVGIGTASNWGTFVVNGKFTGTNANAQLMAIPNRLDDTIGADTQHFWPYGLNYESEGQHESDLVGHCEMVVAIRKDLGM